MKRMSRVSKKSTKAVMLRRRRQLFLGTLLLLCGLGFGLWQVHPAEAAGATITIATKSASVEEGETVYVVITVKSSEAVKGFSGYFTYDNRVLQFVTGGSVVHGNDDAFQIDDTARTESAAKITYSVKFLARKKGNTMISLRKPYEVTAEDDSQMSVSYNSLYIAVKAEGEMATAVPQETQEPQEVQPPQTEEEPAETPEAAKKATPAPTRGENDIAGSNRLRKLSIKGAQMAPDFSPTIKKYSATVTTDKKKLSISYEAEDSLARVVIKGNKKLTEGKNIIKIAVTGTNGKKKVYRIAVTIQRTNGASVQGDSTQSAQPSEDEALASVRTQERTIQSLKYVIGIMAAFCGLMVLTVAAVLLRSRK